MAKAAVLIEALPYIQRFRGKWVVVKFGGSAMEDEKVMDDVLEDVVFLATVGIRPLLVHGGGKSITRAMERAGMKANFVAGHRVTDKDTLDIVVRVLTEETNADIISRIENYGTRAIAGFQNGRSLLRAKKKAMTVKDKRGKTQEVDVGFVGKVVSVDVDGIRRMTDQGGILVIPPIGQDETGQLYNVNADTAAAAVARDLKAEKVVFLSDVHGIMERPGDPDSFLSSVDRSEVDQLVARGVITGGMLPKVEACLDAVRAGVRKAHIIDGTLNHSLLLEIFTDAGVGTEIVDRSRS
jgi:acetylglutamate kinase